MLDFADQRADRDRLGRADLLFAKTGTIRGPHAAVLAVPDLPVSVRKQLYFLRFEDLMVQPAACMSHLNAWLGLSPFDIDPERLPTGATESDSHYHMKYSHRQASRISAPKHHDTPARIQASIKAACAPYYQMYYPAA